MNSRAGRGKVETWGNGELLEILGILAFSTVIATRGLHH